MTNIFFSLFLLILCTSCTQHFTGSKESQVISLQIVDRNGFSETISNRDRLGRYANVDFLSPQPYEKVLRVYGKDKEGKHQSKITNYHPNGQIRQYLELLNGRAHGLYKEWHETGAQKLEATLIEGMGDLTDIAQSSWIFDGKSTAWDDKGRKVVEILYSKGQLAGTGTYFHQSGAISQTVPYENGEIHGTVSSYDEKGVLIEEERYEKGKKHGAAWGPFYKEEYLQDKLMTGTYTDAQGLTIATIQQGHGVQATFENGSLYSLTEYKNGESDGLVKMFASNGNLLFTYQIHDGMKNGEEIHYYPHKPSQPKLQLTWSNDLLHGMVKTWYENGTLESQREMHGNQKRGLAFAWYAAGDLMLMEEYEEDYLLKGSYYKKGSKEAESTIENGIGFATLYDRSGNFLKKIEYEKGSPLLK